MKTLREKIDPFDFFYYYSTTVETNKLLTQKLFNRAIYFQMYNNEFLIIIFLIQSSICN